MNTCKDCKWWGSQPRDKEFANLRQCHIQTDPACNNAVYPYYLHDLDEQDATIETGPEFGCIHWEKKEGEDEN